VEYCGKLKKPANGEELPPASAETPRRVVDGATDDGCLVTL